MKFSTFNLCHNISDNGPVHQWNCPDMSRQPGNVTFCEIAVSCTVPLYHMSVPQTVYPFSASNSKSTAWVNELGREKKGQFLRVLCPTLYQRPSKYMFIQSLIAPLWRMLMLWEIVHLFCDSKRKGRKKHHSSRFNKLVIWVNSVNWTGLHWAVTNKHSHK